MLAARSKRRNLFNINLIPFLSLELQHMHLGSETLILKYQSIQSVPEPGILQLSLRHLY